jgi:hypothetical protein
MTCAQKLNLWISDPLHLMPPTKIAGGMTAGLSRQQINAALKTEQDGVLKLVDDLGRLAKAHTWPATVLVA